MKSIHLNVPFFRLESQREGNIHWLWINGYPAGRVLCGTLNGLLDRLRSISQPTRWREMTPLSWLDQVFYGDWPNSVPRKLCIARAKPLGRTDEAWIVGEGHTPEDAIEWADSAYEAKQKAYAVVLWDIVRKTVTSQGFTEGLEHPRLDPPEPVASSEVDAQSEQEASVPQEEIEDDLLGERPTIMQTARGVGGDLAEGVAIGIAGSANERLVAQLLPMLPEHVRDKPGAREALLLVGPLLMRSLADHLEATTGIPVPKEELVRKASSWAFKHAGMKGAHALGEVIMEVLFPMLLDWALAGEQIQQIEQNGLSGLAGTKMKAKERVER